MSSNDAVEERNKQYQHFEYQWRQLRDTNEGTSSVKRSADLYLPIPTAMCGQNTQSSIVQDDGQYTTVDYGKSLRDSAPWWHPIEAYSNYLQRARFPDIVASCLRGLVGIAIKKEPEIELPPGLAHLEDNATPDGLSLVDLFKRCIFEVMLTGRYELLVDVDSDGMPIFVPYVTESFTNWRGGWDGDKNSPLFAIFEEQIPDPSRGEFSNDTVPGNRVLKIDVDETGLGVYQSAMYVDGVMTGPPVSPSVRGKTLDFVPLTVINSNKLGLDVGPSPMIGISDIAISIYQKDADMSQAEFMTCNPMLILTGVDPDDAPEIVGSAVSYALPNENAKAFYVEPKANCLSHMQTRIDTLMVEAVSYGGSLIGPDKKAAESTETTRVKQAASGATLRSVVENVAQGIVQSLQHAAIWVGADPKSIVFDANLDFSELKLTAQEQTALLQSWLNKGMSKETYVWNMKSASLMPEERTIEAEIDLIDNAPPELVLTPGSSSVPDDEDDFDNEEAEV